VHRDRALLRGAAEAGQQLGGGGPAGGVALERALDQRQQLRRHPLEVRVVVHDPVEHGFGSAGAERRPSRRGQHHRGAPGVDVGRRGDRPPRDLLRREVAGGADDQAAAGQGGDVGGGGQPEVDDLRRAVQHEHVARRQVAVDDAGPVQRREGIGHPTGQLVQRLALQRPPLGDELVEPLPRDEAGDEVRQVGVDVGVQHLHQVRAADAAQRLDLVPEAPAGVRVGHAVAQHLDRHRPLVGGDPEEDGPHPALAESAEQAVRPDDGGVAGAQRCDGHGASPAVE
jgi:hypothetical protein